MFRKTYSRDCSVKWKLINSGAFIIHAMRGMAPQDKPELQAVCNKETVKQIVCFFFFGLLCLVLTVTVITAAPDVLSGSSFATSSVIISVSLAAVLVKLLAPWFMQKISYLKRVVVIVLFCLTGLILLVTAPEPLWRLVGIFIMCLGSSLSEITFLALTSHYKQVTVSAFVAGAGFSSVVGTFYYTGLTTWACVSPRMAITMIIPAVLLFLIFYAILNRGQDQKQTHSETPGANYTVLDEGSDPESSNDSDLEFNKELDPAEASQKPIMKEQFSTARDIYPYISFIFVAYYAKCLINQSVITTIAFKNSPFVPRDHYPYYFLSYHLGEFLGRSHILITACACPSVLPYIRIKKTWILAAVELAHLLFLVFCSWSRFIPHAVFIIILSNTAGFTAGSIYVNSACTVDDLISKSRKKEFALGLFTVGDPVGLLTAGLMGLYVEPQLREHCLYDLRLGQLCLTRYAFKRGWTDSRICT